MLQQISKVLNPKKALYLAYNKAIATESKAKFGFHCMTTHSLAYRYVVQGQGKLPIKNFSIIDIDKNISYSDKLTIVNNINEFTLSKYTNIEDFTTDNKSILYWNMMLNNKLPLSHNGYLKLFHIELSKGLLNGKELDLLLLDEAGDLNELTIEIFKLSLTGFGHIFIWGSKVTKFDSSILVSIPNTYS